CRRRQESCKSLAYCENRTIPQCVTGKVQDSSGGLLFARFQELLKRLGMLLKELREIFQNVHGGGTEMVLDAFDVFGLRFHVETEQRKETRQRAMPPLNPAGDLATLIGQHEAAVFFVIQISELAELLYHARHRRLFDVER